MEEITIEQVDAELAKLPGLRIRAAQFDHETAALGNTPERQAQADELGRVIRAIESLNQVKDSLLARAANSRTKA